MRKSNGARIWAEWSRVRQIAVRRKPRAIDLFCGCGGLTLGLRQAGFKVIGAVDNDSLAARSYKKNHPRVKVWESDIRKLSVDTVKQTLNLGRGQLDLLAGCPPCQGFSTMRTLNRRTVKDDRNLLIDEFLPFVKGLLPKTIMMENVPRILDYYRFARFRRELVRLGYILNFGVLDAAHYGVPQRRRRMILLAGKGHRIEFGEKSRRKRTVFDAIGRMPSAGKSGDYLHDLPERRSEKVLDFIGRIPRNGGSRTDLPAECQLACHIRCTGFKDVYGRMVWEDVAPTITSGCFNPSKGRFLHPEEDRNITLREAAMLQTFPSDYYFSLDGGKTGAALMIGNALPVEFIRRHAKSISAALSSLENSDA